MSLTNEQRLDAYRFFTIAFGAAPGSQYFKQLEDAYKAGMSTSAVVNAFTSKDQFKSIYSDELSSADFANLLIENVVANSANAAAKQEAKQSVQQALAAGMTRGDVIYKIFNNIANKPEDDPKWASVARKMQNQVEVAKFVSEYWPLNTKDLTVLRSSISSVSHETDISTVEKIKEIIQSSGLDLGGLELYTSASDRIEGTDEADMLDGGMGNDTIYGNNGNDVLIGSSGHDLIYGGRGQDYIEGGDGADYIELGAYTSDYWDSKINKWIDTIEVYQEYAHGGSGADTIEGSYGSDTIHGGEGNDEIYGDSPSYTVNVDEIYSPELVKSIGNDLIYGDDGKDYIYGGLGNDTIFGGDGDDYISAQYGDNYLDGGEGSDSISASYDGTNTIFGGAGDDNIYAYGGKDGKISFVDAGNDDDYINVSINGEGESIKIRAGEGSDRFLIFNREDAHIEVDLAESIDLYDYVDISISSYAKAYNPVIINNFSLNKDKINIDGFKLFAGSAYTYKNAPIVTYDNTLRENYIQEVNSELTPWSVVDSKSTHPDSYGKGVFLIKDAAAQSADLATVAKFLDPYGNNAKYGESFLHYFIFNIQDKGVAVYQFQDDTGANDRIVADELTPIAFLTGINTSDLSANDINFFLV